VELKLPESVELFEFQLDFQPNQSGIEIVYSGSGLPHPALFQPNQSGIEIELRLHGNIHPIGFQPNQSGIEIACKALALLFH